MPVPATRRDVAVDPELEHRGVEPRALETRAQPVATPAAEYHEGSAKAAVEDLNRLPGDADALREHRGPPPGHP